MRNLGELMLYIESVEFKNKADLKKQLEEFLIDSDEVVKNSIVSALKTLETISEEELKETKETIK